MCVRARVCVVHGDADGGGGGGKDATQSARVASLEGDLLQRSAELRERSDEISRLRSELASAHHHTTEAAQARDDKQQELMRWVRCVSLRAHV